MKIDYADLVKKATYARVSAYAPYSKYKVGAALICGDGTIYKGANIENSAYSESVCAERVAFYHAITKGGNRDFKAIAIVGAKDDICEYAFPCGSCRQVMSEFCDENFKIVLYNGKEIKTYTLKKLFPEAFTKNNIK